VNGNERNQISENALLWKQQSDSTNADINTQWLKSNVVDFNDISLKNCTWVYSHVPKTAGTALESYLIQAFELKHVLNIDAVDLNELPECLYLRSRLPQFITGYHPLNGMLYQLLNNEKVVHISMMRDPIERIVSFFNHNITQRFRSKNHSGENLSFDEYINQSHLKEINNGQSRRLAGVIDSDEEISDKELYFKARFAIDNCFTVVGVTEFFSQFHKLIAKKCGVIFHDLPPITRLETKVQLANLKPEQIKIIKQKNKVDIQLYQYVRSKFLNLINS